MASLPQSVDVSIEAIQLRDVSIDAYPDITASGVTQLLGLGGLVVTLPLSRIDGGFGYGSGSVPYAIYSLKTTGGPSGGGTLPNGDWMIEGACDLIEFAFPCRTADLGDNPVVFYAHYKYNWQEVGGFNNTPGAYIDDFDGNNNPASIESYTIQADEGESVASRSIGVCNGGDPTLGPLARELPWQEALPTIEKFCSGSMNSFSLTAEAIAVVGGGAPPFSAVPGSPPIYLDMVVEVVSA